MKREFLNPKRAPLARSSSREKEVNMIAIGMGTLYLNVSNCINYKVVTMSGLKCRITNKFSTNN